MTAFTSGWSSNAIDGHLVAVHDVEDAVGQTGFAPQRSPIQFAAEGSFSLGFSTTVLPQAMAMGKNHIGTMAGKLNGVMTATTPSGWRIECTSTFVDALSVEPALQQVRNAASELDDLEAAADLAEGVAEDLAVLRGEDRGKLCLTRVEQLAELEEHLRSFGQRRSPPLAKRARCCANRCVDVVRSGEQNGFRHCAGGGVGDVTAARSVAYVRLSVHPVGDHRE